LIALARNSNRPRETRRTAMMWIGMSADASAAPALDSIARGDVDERSMREAALTALSSLDDGAGVPALTRLARGSQESWLRKQATFWLGNAEDPRARTAVRELAASDTVPEEIRKQAIFALGHLQRADGDDEFLRSLYPRLTSQRLKDQLIMSMGQSEQETGKRWLLGIVVNADEPMQMRKQALFWAGQNQWLPVKELVSIYPKLSEMALKEHFVFVLSQRKESDATDKMIDIAKNDPDRGTRKKALFWLGQMDDPKVAKFLLEAIEK
jgi:HEAT repeat protein